MSHICLWLCAGLFVCCCSWADKITGKVLPTDTPHHAYTLIEPLGVVAAVSHYNILLHISTCCLTYWQVLGGASDSRLSPGI